MKIAKVIAGIFGAAGLCLLVGSIGLCLFSLNAPVRMERTPEGAVACSEQLSQAISQKEFAALEDCLYGQPSLGMEETKGSGIWDLHMQSLSFSWQGDCYAGESGIFRDAAVTYLDTASVTENLQTRAHALMTQRVESATEMEQLYDEAGEFREDLVDQVMAQALAESIAQDARTVTANVTVELIQRDGRWFALPEQTLMLALAGGLT